MCEAALNRAAVWLLTGLPCTDKAANGGKYTHFISFENKKIGYFRQYFKLEDFFLSTRQ